MVEIELFGERGKKTLLNMSRLGRACCVRDNIYQVSETTLSMLIKLDASFRRLNIAGYPERSQTKNSSDIALLERHSGKLVVQKVGQNEATALEHLSHPKAKYRFAALDLLYIKWRLTQEAADICEDLVESDPDANVRALAATCLGSYYLGSGNRRISELLARIVSNVDENLEVRRSAYWSLFPLQENHRWERPNVLNFQFPQDVNWPFVDFCLRYNIIRRTFRRVGRFLLRLCCRLENSKSKQP
jgi:hypothetical protein